MNRENLKLLIVATVCLTAGWSGPAVAGAAVTFAQNSDKVDGKHAVGSGASTTTRKGKLVATNPTTGRLPNNIIAVAPDSAKLGGVSAAGMRTMSLPAASVMFTGDASDGFLGASLPASGGFQHAGFRTTFVVPPAHRTGAAMTVELLLKSSGALCQLMGELTGTVHVTGSADENFYGGTTPYVKVGDAHTIPVTASTSKVTFGLPTAAKAGDLIELQFTRRTNLVQDNCAALDVYGIQVRY